MYKDQLNSALERVVVSERFKVRLISSIKMSGEKPTTPRKSIRKIQYAAIFTLFILFIGAFSLPRFLNHHDSDSTSEDFEIIGKLNGEACYISVLYLDGYEYTPSSWLSYSIDDGGNIGNYEIGDKIGEVTLDLKGLRYTGTPPEFSSTHDVGTKIYELKGVKKEYAILMKDQYSEFIAYRSRKFTLNEDVPLNLTIADILNMISDDSIVTSVELRSEENGSWMRTTEEEQLLSLINKELPEKPLLSKSELGKDLTSYRVVTNLMLSDGAVLSLQFYPEQRFAYVFGGYIEISEELANSVVQLNQLGDSYPKITNILSMDPSKIHFLNIINHVEEREILCEMPAWSGSALYEWLNYYRVTDENQIAEGKLLMSMMIDQQELNFYENDNQIIDVEINGTIYKIVKGQITYHDLVDYLENYTEWLSKYSMK